MPKKKKPKVQVEVKLKKPKRAPIDVMFEKFIKDPNNNPEVYNSAEYKALKAVDPIPFSSALAQANHNKKVSETAMEKAMVNQATEKDPVIAKAIHNIRVLEDEVDEAKGDFLQRDIDDIFDPEKRKALAEKLDMTEDAILDQLQIISARKENQRMVDEEPCHLAPENIEFVDEPILEIEQFYDESVGGYIQILDEVEEKVSPPSEAEDLATTLALTTDIYTDAKDNVLDVAKLTDLLAKQPELLNRGSGGYTGNMPPNPEQIRHNRSVEAKLEKLIEIAKNQAKPSVNQWSHTKTATKEELDKTKEELAVKNKVIADMFAERQRKKQNNLGGNDPVTNFKEFIGLKVYEDYCKKNNKRGDKVCGTDHLEDFHADEIYSSRIKESIDYHRGEKVNIDVPKTDDGTTWRGIQTVVFKKLGIKKGGKSRSRKGNRRQL